MRSSLLLLLAFTGISVLAQTPNRTNVARILDFESGTSGQYPAGWGGSRIGEIKIEADTYHSGRQSASIERKETTSDQFSTITATIPDDFDAQIIELKGAIKTENVRDFAAIWLRLDGDPGQSLAFASLQSTPLKGTNDWQEYSVRIQASPAGKMLIFGFLLSGPGKAWVDDLQLLADGKPVAEARPRPVVSTSLDKDTEFVGGSKISIDSLSDLQISNLATLGRVWGFVKYHHSVVTRGDRHWDFDLFRVLPSVFSADSRETGNRLMTDWIVALGPVPECQVCATTSSGKDLYLAADIGWIKDTAKLGVSLSQLLESVYRNRSSGPQFFAGVTPGVGNPTFDRELPYPSVRFPDSGYQLLALFRFWNIMRYFNPNRDIMQDEYHGSDPAGASKYWDDVLTQSIPAFAAASDKPSYQRELLKLIGKVHDTHANLWSSIAAARPPVGQCQMPIDIRIIEGRPVVTRRSAKEGTDAGPIAVGDVILRIDDREIEALMEQWRPYYADSNEAARLRDIARSMTNGMCGAVKVSVLRDGSPAELVASRVSPIGISQVAYHDLPGPAFQKLAADIAYIKISDAKQAEVPKYFEQAQGTAGLIIDLRDYPSDFPIFQIGGRLVASKTAFVQFTQVDLANPGAFSFREGASLQPIAPRYMGKVVILVDEITLSSAEYHAMAFRTTPGAIVIGSTTAGADGNVSNIPLPGGERSMISGIGVLYPDKRPTQRIGIVPDIELKPTIAGIKAGKDELIDEAIRQIRTAVK